MNPSIIGQFTNVPLALIESRIESVIQSIKAMATKSGEIKISASHDWYGNEIKRAKIENGVAIIPLRGVVSKGLGPLGEYFGFLDVSRFTADVASAISDPNVKRIAIDCASPGGTVLGTRDAAEMVAKAAKAKPTMVYTDDLMASAAYYIAAGANTITVSGGSYVGSVGVYTIMLDATQFWQEMGAKFHVIRSGDHKAIGARGVDPLDDDKLAKVQSEIDALGEEFRAWVNAYRTIDASVLQGQVFTGHKAIEHGFADNHANTFSEALTAFANTKTNTKSSTNMNQLMTVLAELGLVANASLGEADAIAQVKANVSTIQKSAAATTASLATTQGRLIEANDKVATLTDKLAKAESENDQLKAKEQDIEKRASAKAVEIVAKQGGNAPVAVEPTATATGTKAVDKTSAYDAWRTNHVQR